MPAPSLRGPFPRGYPAGSRKSAATDTLPYLPRLGKRGVLLVEVRLHVVHLDRPPQLLAQAKRRWRERRAAGTPIVRYVKAAEPKRSRPERWRAAVATLRELQESYQTWRDNLPESLEDSATAELLDAVIAVDLDQLDIELPTGFGRD